MIGSWEMNKNEIYDLKLHENIFNGIEITRVPGGWIYSISNWAVFVPYNNEFYQKEPSHD